MNDEIRQLIAEVRSLRERVAQLEAANLSLSATDILNSIKTVDGSGSGLDADTVDGVQASAIGQLGVAANWTAAQTVIAAGLGAKRASSGTGAQIGYIGAVASQLSMTNGSSFTFTYDTGLAGLLFAVSFAGFGVLFWAPTNSATIVELADPGNAHTTAFTASKSANSTVITITNNYGGTYNCTVMAFGAITAHT